MATAFIGPAVGVATSLLGGFLGSRAANQAAGILSTGATQAGNLAATAGQQAQGYQQQQLASMAGAAQPYIGLGAGAAGQLGNLMGPGGFLSSTWNQQFQAPTAAEAAATPGYEFTREQGINALNRGAAARGNLLSSGAAKQLEQYGTGLANQTYNDVYARQMGQYQQSYQQYLNNQAGLYGRLMGVSGQGLNAVSDLNRLRQQASQFYGGVGMQAAGWQGQDITNAAAARAQGVMGAANAWRQALSNIGGMGMATNFSRGGGSGGGGGPADFSGFAGDFNSSGMSPADFSGIG
jgi:hypothetical protein